MAGRDRSSRFWDRIAERYSRRPVADEAAYQRKLEVTREYFDPAMDVLEIGCGTGSTAIAHAPHVRHIRAVDISEKMIEIAKRKADAANIGNVTFERSSVDELRVPDETQDAVLALSILHLVEDRDDVIARIYRMLKPGGVLVSSTVCLGDTMRWFKLIGPIGWFLGLMPLVRVFTVDDLRQSMTGAGFRIDHEWQPGDGRTLFLIAKK